MRVYLTIIALLCLAASVVAVLPGDVDMSIVESNAYEALYTLDHIVPSETADLSHFSLSTPSEDGLTTDYAFSLDDAKKFTYLAAASYCARFDTTGLTKWTCAACKKSGLAMSEITKIFVSSTNTHGFVGYLASHKRIILAFTGTNPASMKNWITNLAFGAVSYKGCSGCNTHSGFLSAYQGARASVVTAVSALMSKYPGSTLSITGHSLGGALASHAILDFKSGVFTISKLGGVTWVHNGNSDYDLPAPLTGEQVKILGGTVTLATTYSLFFPAYTIGQPRLGNDAFGAYALQKLGATSVYRLTHNRDPVPHLPPQAVGYTHGGAVEVFFNKENTSYTVCSKTNPEDKACSNQFTFEIGISDHLNYAGIQFDSGADAC